MTSFSSSRDSLLRSLRLYNAHLEAKNEALARLSQTSTWLKSVLEQDDSECVEKLLKEREIQCKHLMEICKNDSKPVIDSALRLTNDSSEVGQTARTTLALNDRSQVLSRDIVTSQQHCEAVLKTRLQATSHALRQSVQRRKLDAAYGPAYKHTAPTFMDKQR